MNRYSWYYRLDNEVRFSALFKSHLKIQHKHTCTYPQIYPWWQYDLLSLTFFKGLNTQTSRLLSSGPYLWRPKYAGYIMASVQQEKRIDNATTNRWLIRHCKIDTAALTINWRFIFDDIAMLSLLIKLMSFSCYFWCADKILLVIYSSTTNIYHCNGFDSLFPL